jgi:chemotaxis protein methyltransferase CheR
VLATPPTADPVLAAWREYAERRTGLSVSGPLAVALARAVGERVRAGRFGGPAELLRHVAGHPDGEREWQAVFVRLLNADTRFFRDGPSFTALADHLLPAVVERRAAEQTVRIWSAGCSTGQEAYSLAMNCLAGVPAGWDVRVTGTDANPDNLTRAIDGRFRPFEMASVPEAWRKQFMPVGPDGRRAVGERVRSVVTFTRLDLVNDTAYPLPPQDVIFCQNVFIYYAAEVRARLVRRLGAALAPGGYLCLGPADPVGEPPAGLVPVRLPDVRVYQRVA